MPDPVAPAAPAPAPPSSAATPVTAPAVPPASVVPAPVANPSPVVAITETTAVPAVEAPTVVVEAPAAVVAKPGKPDIKDFPDDVEGFLREMHKWDAENPGESEVEGKPAAEEASAAEVKEEEDKPATQAEDKPVEETKPEPLPATPEQLTEWTAKSPKFAEALEENPELKGQIYAMARYNAKAAPVLEIVSSPEEARFAVDTATKFVDLRSGFAMAAEDPARFAPAIDQFTEEFRVKDANGNYVLDPTTGKPQLAEDYGLIRNHFVQEQFAERMGAVKGLVEELKAKLASAVYPSDAAKQADQAKFEDAEYTLAALEHIEKAFDGGAAQLKRPELPADASPELKAWQEDLIKREEALKGTKEQTAKEQRVTQRKTFEAKLQNAYGGGVGKYLDEQLKALKDRGEYIPDFVLQERYINPQGQETKVSAFAMRVLNNFNAAVNKDLEYKRQLATLEMMPPSPEAEAARLALYTSARAKHLPAVFDAEVKRIQDGIRKDRPAIEAGKAKQAEAATLEPKTGVTPTTKVLTDQQMYEQARATVAKSADYAYKSGAEQEQMVISEVNRLRAQRR